MRVTAKMNGNIVGTKTRTASQPGTWPTDTLSCRFAQGFNSVVIHYDSHPPTCQDYGVIYLADNMTVTALNNPSALSSGTRGGSYALPVTSINGCPVNGSWSLFVGDDAAGNNTSLNSFDLNISNNVTPILYLKTFIEGFYFSNGYMNPLLYTANLSTDPTATDTITVELHNITSPYSTFSSAKLLLHTDGSASVELPSSVMNNSFYLTIKHRNSIETWSGSPVIFNNSAIFYDFTASVSQAYGSNLKETFDQMGWAIYSGDFSDSTLGSGFQDGIIEAQDYTDMENAVSSIQTGYTPEDITGDCIVEATDYLIEENNLSNIIYCIRP